MITEACQRWRERVGSYRPAGEVFDAARHEVAPIADDTTARAFVEAHHYSGSYVAARRRFGLYERAELVGVAVYSVPVRAEVLRPFDASAAVELGRLVLLDRAKANAESWFVAECHRRLAREGFEGVVSFSDPEPRARLDGRVVFAGHIGTVYQALNATYTGRAKPDTIYLLPDGRLFPRRALVKVRKRERGWRYAVDTLVAAGAPTPGADLDAWLAVALSTVLRRQRHGGNHRYTWALSRAGRRVLPASLPYPKLGGLA